MKNDYVRDWMTPNPIVVDEDMTLPDVHAMMKEYNVRRLPVVDKHGHLVGIVAQSDVREAQPSDATTLSIYELNYLLAKLKVNKIMTAPVVSISLDNTIADAAKMMLEHKIGGLPVIEDGKVVGIITESDIFRLVVKRYSE